VAFAVEAWIARAFDASNLNQCAIDIHQLCAAAHASLRVDQHPNGTCVYSKHTAAGVAIAIDAEIRAMSTENFIFSTNLKPGLVGFVAGV
jgi:hypothetical protein